MGTGNFVELYSKLFWTETVFSWKSGFCLLCC